MLHILSYRKSLDSEDHMAVTYYLLLQDHDRNSLNRTRTSLTCSPLVFARCCSHG